MQIDSPLTSTSTCKLVFPTMLEAVQLYVPASAAFTRLILSSPDILLKVYGMESILTGLSVISTGSVPSGRAHWIEGAGRPVTLHWRVWMESKIATGWVGGTVIEGGTVLVGSKKEEEEEGNRRGEEEEKKGKE